MPCKEISVIIPTYNRDIQVVQRTIDSILQLREIRNKKLSFEILIVDQNFPKLDLKSQYSNSRLKFYEIYAEHSKCNDYTKKSENSLIHFYGLNPSLPRARNFGIERSQGKYIIFFDDDVEVHENCIVNYWHILQSDSKIGFVGGREIIPFQEAKRSPWKNFVLDILYKISKHEDTEYIANNKYIGRIKPNSFMYWNFDEDCSGLIRIDSARGCNWALSRQALGNDVKFDPMFQGNALREDTDVCMQLQKKGYVGYYSAQSKVTHYRQAGGCENLDWNLNSFISKLNNEVYFQNKHFPQQSQFYLFMRLVPLIIGHLRTSRGRSLIIGLSKIVKLNKNLLSFTSSSSNE